VDVSETLFRNLSLLGALPFGFERSVFEEAHRSLSECWRNGAFAHLGNEVFAFHEGRQAIEHIANGQVRGKVVVRVR
jgi:NADPH2:quinone reductase